MTAASGMKADGQRPDAPRDHQRHLLDALPPLRGYQQEAVEAIVQGAARDGRGQVIAACGTGKTLIAAHAAVRCCPRGLVVIVCPSLALVGQTLRVWRPLGAYTAAVCSDDSVADVAGHTDPTSCPVLADPDEITAWLHHAPHGRMRLLAVTNTSADRVGTALLAAGMTADLLIIDEAHRTAGPTGKTFARIHDDTHLPATIRVNMTATPRIITPGRRHGEPHEALSMDDPSVFGPVWHRYPFGQAITDGWLDDFRIVVIGIRTHDALRVLQDVNDDRVTAIGEAPLRTAVVQTALLRAAAEFGLRRVLVFTPRVADSREFASTLARTAARLPAAQQPKGRLTTGHVDGQQNLRQRQIHLDRLAEPPDDGWTVISSARALTEGIDVPAVDAVVLTRPMRSTVQTVQTVGRALRRNPRGTGIATILVPLLLPDDPSRLPHADDEWMAALQVLWAMRAHDDTLATDLDTRHHHARTGSRQPRLPERVLLRMPDGYLTDSLLRDITIRILDHATTGRAPTQPTESWTAGITAARTFRHREGHLDVPRHHRESDIDLGSFIHNCRGRHRRSELTPDQILTLEQLGITWRVFDARWQRHLAAFTTFHTREGHLRVPRHHREGDINLGSIAHNLRNQRKRNLVPHDRIDALDALGFPWTHSTVMPPASPATARNTAPGSSR
ncbi:DEAD/DEAH box helicase [Micromonospora sp. HM134]|uniref:DEAD/DEAH box helicase n=1 Tax=Micromonospora sp. HM134 TaxID=2583243 RepID=UPI00119863FC|nr:DEAD/DEAH box helicase [Micromonospora sp. HM134]QDY09432.1 DEAD/DEAH box helicase [Micromonospora sp. HM134]